MDNPECEGSFRKDDNIYVVNGITGEVAHEPPSFSVVSQIIDEICFFANTDEEFIHPIVKAIIIHFMIAFLHPFVDGNGRTARALFYWYMLKKGYWITEFLSISKIIYKKKRQYEKSFLYTEHDDFDLGYFIQYNMNVLKDALEELKIYLERKSSETAALLEFKNISGISERQAQILKMIQEKPGVIFECKNLTNFLGVSVKTVRSDFEKLVNLGFMNRIPLNQRLVGYTKSASFEKKLKENKGK
ncbi:MAG: Fic family protein [Treponema sp.]|nr:Fic family protein [Treponema sp.]